MTMYRRSDLARPTRGRIAVLSVATAMAFGGLSWIAGSASTASTASAAGAVGLAPLQPVPAIIPCERLVQVDLKSATDTPAIVKASKQIESAAGPFCQVRGTIQPRIEFELDLPINGWQQRYLQTGCGGTCGMLHVDVAHAGSCLPALQGGLAVASDDMGHQNRMGPPGSADDAAFGEDPQLRIDFAYRANHATALVAQALIRAFYGQPPRYSYFSGCSDGGREALVEAERYPKDFDGIAAGAPAMNFQVQNSFYHAWQYRSNTDAAGKHILLAGKLPVLHRAALAACDALDGLKDGLISDPRACHFDPGAAQCPANAPDTSNCLTSAEVEVARKLYAGPTDAQGHHFTVGGPQPGSELSWAGVYVPDTPDGHVMSQMAAAGSSQYLIFPQVSAAEGDIAHFEFTTAHFAQLSALHPLYDATDTDLAPFEQHGGKLILWHGWSDPHISPINSIAYYTAVRKQLGGPVTDKFLRLFLFPGMYHCGGGDGFSQFDILTPLMAWVESGSAPERIVAAQVPEMPMMPMMMGPPPGAGAPGPGFKLPPGGPGGPLPPGGPPGNGPPASSAFLPLPMSAAPLPRPDAKALRTRPVFPYPTLAKYIGHGSADDAANYAAVPGPFPEASGQGGLDGWAGADFYAPDFLRWYVAKGKQLEIVGSKRP